MLGTADQRGEAEEERGRTLMLRAADQRGDAGEQ